MNLITLLWSDGRALIPTDFRIYNSSKDGLTKDDHFTSMLKVAKEGGFNVSYVLFDCWYSSLEKLKAVRGQGWHRRTAQSAGVGGRRDRRIMLTTTSPERRTAPDRSCVKLGPAKFTCGCTEYNIIFL